MRLLIFIILIISLIQAANAAFIPDYFIGEFEEVHTGANIPVKIKYLKGGNVYYTSFDPDEKDLVQLIYVCNPKVTYKYTPPLFEDEKGELAKGDSNKFCYAKIFDSLRRGLVNNDVYKVSAKKNKTVLTFSKAASKQLGLTQIDIQFKNKSKSSITDIASMKFHFEQKPEPTLYKFKKINLEQKLNKADFEFQIPENTNVKEMN